MLSQQRRGEGWRWKLSCFSLLMPWFNLNVNGANVPGSSPNAFETRGLMYIVLVVVLAIISNPTLGPVGETIVRGWRIGGCRFARPLITLLSRGAGRNRRFVECCRSGGRILPGTNAFLGLPAAIIAFLGALRVRKERRAHGTRPARTEDSMRDRCLRTAKNSCSPKAKAAPAPRLSWTAG